MNPLETPRVLEGAVDDLAENSNQVKMPEQEHNGVKHFPEIHLRQDYNYLPSYLGKSQNNVDKLDNICQYIIKDMNSYGVCVVDKFLGDEKGLSVLDEVLHMYSAGMFKDGQLVSNKSGASDLKTIRGDQITWLDGKEKNCQSIGMLISKVDAIIMRANKMLNNGKMGEYTINGRTKVNIYFLSICKISYFH